MTIHFTKMHSLGNDFIIIDAINQNILWHPTFISDLAKRNTGIGFDQCLLVEPSKEANIDFFYRIFNADGHEVNQCGNGARCLARFVYHYGLTHKKTIIVATHSMKMQLHLNDDATVTVNMGKPKLQPKDIPLKENQQAKYYSLPLPNNFIANVHAINVGNPHAITLIPTQQELKSLDLNTIGKQISHHYMFSEQCNAGFMQINDSNNINLRVYERGCGETLACGSGAVAAAATGRLYHNLAEKIKVNLPGGELTVTWPNIKGDIYLTGCANFVYEGTLF